MPPLDIRQPAVAGLFAWLATIAVAATAAAAPIALTPPPFDGSVVGIAVAPDLEHVAFLTEAADESGTSAWWTRIDGTIDPIRISGTLDRVIEVTVSPDSRRVAFTDFGNLLLQVYTVDVSSLSSTPTPPPPTPVLVSTPSDNGRAHSVRFTDDSARVVFLEGPNNSIRRVWSAPADGGAPAVQLSEGDDNCTRFELLASGRVVFDAQQLDENRQELFFVPADGSASPSPLSLFPGEPTDIEQLERIEAWSLSPDRSRVVYLAVQRSTFPPPDPQVVDVELYSVPADGASGDEVRLDFAEAMGDSASDRSGPFEISLDGSHVVFRLSRFGAGGSTQNVYASPINGASPPTLLAEQSDSVSSFVASTAHAVYRSGSPNSLRSVTFGGVETVLDGEPVSTRPVADGFLATPDGLRTVYPVGTTRALWSRRLDGAGPPIELTPPLGSNGAVQPDFAVSPTSSHVVYRSDFELDGEFELYATETAGGPAVKLNDPPISGRRVFGFVVAPDGGCVLFQSQQSTSSPRRLFAADLDGACGVSQVLFVDGFESGETSRWEEAQ